MPFSRKQISESRRYQLLPQFLEPHQWSCPATETSNVMPSGEAGQWGPRLSHCGHWHWTVMAHLSPVWFRVVLRFPFGQLDWLSYVPIRGLPLEQCPVVITLILLLVINGDFYLQYYMVWDWFCMDWDCLMFSFLDTVRTGTAFSFPFLSTIRVWAVSLIEYYTDFRLVLSQVGSVLQLYLRSFEVEGKP